MSLSRLALPLLGFACCAALVFFGVSGWLGEADAASRAPIAAYSLDKGEGIVAEDITGNGHEGAIEGATWTTHGKYGSALEFDGENDCVAIPNTEDLQLSEEFTLEAWVRPQALHEFTPIFFKSREGFYSYSLFLGAFESGHLEGFVANSSPGWSEVGSPEALPAKTWSHVAFTSDGAHLRLYVNGELVDTSSAREIGESEGPLYLGCWPEEGEHFEGRIDEVRVYDRALDGGDVGGDLGEPLQTPQDGPVATYAFDEGEGTVAYDDTGNGHDGTIEGATWTKGKFGSALDFNAAEEDVVTIPMAPDLDLEDFTLEAWVKPSEVNELMPALAKGSGEGFGYALYGAGAEEPSIPTGYITEGESVKAFATGEEELSTKTWTHIAVTSDGNKLRFYVDGKLVDTRSGANVISGGETALHIGGDTSIANPEYFDGKIDEVRIYNRALSEAEIVTDVHSGIQTPQVGPIAAYSLDRGEGSVAEDLTGNGHQGAIEGATWTTRGKYGDALEFDGENDCVKIPNTEDLQLSEEFTLEAWVRPQSLQEFAPIFFKEREGFYSYSLFLGAFESGHLQGYVANESPGWSEVESGTLPAKIWSHIAFTSDGAHLRLYVNGELVDTSSAREAGESEGPLYLGCWPEEGEHFEGRIDEVRVYDRALDGGEVGSDMVSGLQTSPSPVIAAYAFDEGEGTVAHDYAGGHDGTIEGATWTKGKFGSALDFNAAEEDVVTIPTSPDLNLEDFTLEAWVKPSEVNELMPVIAKGSGEGFGYALYGAGAEEPSIPTGYITEGESVDVYATGEEPLAAHAWTHIAVTSDDNKMRFYVDGKLVDTRTGANLIAGGETDLHIGGDTSIANPEYFDGKIDEVRIYGRALSEVEIAADQHSGIQTPQQGAIAAYSLDKGEGTVAEDITGNGHEGAIEGATWTTHGKYGDALELDGENDCVKIPNTEDLQLSEEFTLEAWVRPQALHEFTPIFFKSREGFYSYSLFLGAFESGHLEGFVANSSPGWSEVGSPEALPAKAWSHVAFTSDGAHLRLYVNGELVDTSSAREIGESEGPLYLGCWPEESEHFEGRIDEVRVYDRALDGAEVGASQGPMGQVQTEESEADSTEAVLLGTVDPMGQVTSYRFEYGTTTAYGQVIPESPDEIERWLTGNEPEEVDQAIDELEPETTYHYRIVAINRLGTVVGQDQTFTTSEAEISPLAATAFEGRVGINWSGEPTSAAEMKLVNESGAGMFRVVIYPGCPSIKGDVNRQETHNDELFLYMAQKHITILPDVSGIPCRQDNRLPRIDSGTGALKRWKDGLERLVKRYGPEGKFWEEHASLKAYAPTYWEMWNEENVEKNAADTGHIIPQRYGQLLGVSNSLLGEVDGKVKILFGGLLTIGKTRLKTTKNGPEPAEREMTIRRFIREAGHSEDYDAVSLHPYAFKGSIKQVTLRVKANVKSVRNAVNKYGGGQGKEIWITEIGWPVEGETEPDTVHVAVSPAVQEERLNSVFEMLKNQSGQKRFNIANIFWYNVKDAAGSIWDKHCGLVDLNGNKRSAFSAFKAQAE